MAGCVGLLPAQPRAVPISGVWPNHWTILLTSTATGPCRHVVSHSSACCHLCHGRSFHFKTSARGGLDVDMAATLGFSLTSCWSFHSLCCLTAASPVVQASLLIGCWAPGYALGEGVIVLHQDCNSLIKDVPCMHLHRQAPCGRQPKLPNLVDLLWLLSVSRASQRRGECPAT